VAPKSPPNLMQRVFEWEVFEWEVLERQSSAA
jgi:hypothetical protein